jgi:hypothetical protein
MTIPDWGREAFSVKAFSKALTVEAFRHITGKIPGGSRCQMNAMERRFLSFAVQRYEKFL